MRERLVAGNWKMHGSLAANQRLLDALKLGAPSAPAGTGIALGAQTLSEHDSGAYTGEVSGAMLRELGCRYAIVGHSERRQLFGERDAQIAAKFAAAQRTGL